MNEVKSIYQNQSIVGKSPPRDLRHKYAEMVEDVRASPPNIVKHQQLMEVVLVPFSESKGELVITEKKICFSFNGEDFTNFGVVLLGVIVVHKIDSTEYYVELLVLGQDIPPKITRLRSSALCSNRWIENLGPQYIFERREIERLQNLIKAMSKYAPLSDEYEYSGWEVEKGKTYIMEGHQLNGETWDKDRAKRTCDHALKMLDVASYSLTIPLFSIELLSLVHSKLVAGGTYFKGVCCIVAPTQSFKTTLAALFLNLNNGLEADINFEATTAAIVRVIGSVRDSTVILDDYKPGATKAECNDMLQKLGKVVRMCSDDSGGVKRAGAQNLTISNIANCLLVITAEQIQLNVQSTLARLLIFEGNRQSVSEETLTHFQVNHSKYKAFVEDYISHIIIQDVDEYCKELVERFFRERDTLRNQLPDKRVFVDNRTNDMCVWLYVSFGEFLDYALGVNTINQEQFEKYSQEALQIFLSLMEQQAERVSELDDTKRFFKALQVLIETKEAKIEKLQPRTNSFLANASQDAIGFSKKGFIYLKNGTAFQRVVAYYRRFGKEFSVSEAALRKSLWDNGCILQKSEKTCIHRLFVNHETYQCIQFDEKEFYKLLNGGRKNGSEADEEVPGNWGRHKNADNFLGR